MSKEIGGRNPATSSAWLVRHGESVANAGGPVGAFSEIPLTPRGERQAQLFAERFYRLSAEAPTQIAISAYLRARQTARPMLQRFQHVPAETWPIHEFTYLDPIASHGMNEIQRTPLYADYWQREDPAYTNPNGAESFTGFMDRVRGTIGRLAGLDAGSRVTLFTHGYFMQGVRLALLFPQLSDRAMMRASLALNERVPIANTEILELRIEQGAVTLLGHEHITPLTLEPTYSGE
jgi:broad specificity phosphatase PhoE